MPEAVPDLEIHYDLHMIRRPDELEAAYRLRYEVYRALGYLQIDTPHEREVDAFDAVSILLGAFDVRTGVLAGTVRVVAPLISSTPLCPLSLPSVVSTEVAHAIVDANPGDRPIRELSRLVVRMDHQGNGIAQGLVDLAAAHAAAQGAMILVASCLPRHVPVYNRCYGFRDLPVAPCKIPSVDQIGCVILCTLDGLLPERMRSRMTALGIAARHGSTDLVDTVHRGIYARFDLAGLCDKGPADQEPRARTSPTPYPEAFVL